MSLSTSTIAIMESDIFDNGSIKNFSWRNPSLEDFPINLASARFTPLETIIFLAVVIPVILFTIVSNLFVIAAISKYPPLKNPANIFLLSLAITDGFMMGCCVMPIACYYNVIGIWHFGVTGCKIWTFLSFFTCANSVLHLCIISIDRYMAIAHPFTYAPKRSYAKSVKMLLGVWLCSFVLIMPPFFLDWGMTWPTEFTPEVPCTIPQETSYAVFVAMGGFFIPLFIIVLVYIKLYQITHQRFQMKIEKASNIIEIAESSHRDIASRDQESRGAEVENLINKDDAIALKTLVNNEAKREIDDLDVEANLSKCDEIKVTKCMANGSKRSPSPPTRCKRCDAVLTSSQSRKSQDSRAVCKICSAPNNLLVVAEKSRLAILIQRERKSMFIITCIVWTFIACWLPGYSMFLVLSIWPKFGLPTWVIIVTWWLAYSNSACNPVIYTIFNPDFKNIFKKIFRFRRNPVNP